jgi:hypothetical protein
MLIKSVLSLRRAHSCFDAHQAMRKKIGAELRVCSLTPQRCVCVCVCVCVCACVCVCVSACVSAPPPMSVWPPQQAVFMSKI